MSIKRYEEYKETSISWVNKIPKHWELLPTKRAFRRKKETNAGMKLDNRLALTMKGVVKRSLDDLEGLQASEYETYQIFQEGDLAFKLIDLQNIKTSRVGIVPEEGIMSPAYIRLVGIGRIGPKYAYWYFMKLYHECIFNELGGGVRQTIGSEELLSLPLTYPPKGEQLAIVRFLDRETAKIDALIAEQERLIELLQEKRQAVISHAVTKGLNPDAPMKESGVQWLGEVPEHWELRRGRFLYMKREEAIHQSDEVVTAFRDGQVIQRNLRRVDGFTLALLEVGYQHVCVGDLVIHGMDAFAGAIGVSESEGKCTPEYSICHPINSSHRNDYFAHALRVMAKRDYIYVICPSVRERAPRFRFNTFKDVVLPVPPPDEQAEISKTITDECSRLAELASRAESLMAVLKERRSALISAAVTGQIDVRGLTPQEEPV